MNPAFLDGGGEMGSRIRAFDWGNTALGPTTHWPAALRTTLRILLTTNHPVFLFWGPQQVCFYNDAYSRSLGPEKHPSMLGGTARLEWQEIWPVIGPQIERVMSGAGATWHENQLLPITRHGKLEEVYWTYSYGPVDDETAPGGVGGVLVLCTETTPQMLLAQRLRASEKRWLSMFDQAPGFICVLQGPGHHYEYANQRYQELLSHRALIGRRAVDCAPEVAAQGFIDLLDRVYASGQPHVARAEPLKLQPAGGGEPVLRYLDFVYQPMRDASGQVTGIFVEGHDVTASKLDRLALASFNQQARERAEELEAVMHSVPASIWIAHDPECLRITGNPQSYRLLRMGSNDNASATAAQQGQTQRPFREFIDGAPAAAHQLPLQRATASGQAVPAMEISLVFDDGEARHIYGGAAPLRDEAGAVRGAVGAFVEITALKLAQSRLEQRERELREGERRKDEFLATLAHELRNPLAPLRSGLNILQQSPDTHQARQALAMMGRQVSHMVWLIDDLLDVSRISAGKLALRLAPVTLQQVADAALEVSMPTLQASGHRVELSYPPQPLWLHADLTRLAQVVGNLLNNAAKYTPRGGQVRLVLEADTATAQALLRVSDNGIGIPAQMLDEVFEMFAQVDHNAQTAQSGLGVGLALARSIVAMHGGSVQARSEGPGCGSEFTMALPLAAAPVLVAQGHDTPAAHSNGSGLPVAPPKAAARRVLVVDDNRDAADSLAMLISLSGHEVRTAYDARQGLAAVRGWGAHIAFIDIGLPGMDGHAMAHALRQETAAVMLVAVTGWGAEQDERRSRAAGFDLHLTKPVALHAVEEALSQAAAS